VLAAFQAADLEGYTVVGCDCQGQCSSGPTVRIIPEETWYCQVQPSDVPIIIEQHLRGGEPVEAKLHPRIHRRFSF
jgi:(2Fe-2S) ferredoxin